MEYRPGNQQQVEYFNNMYSHQEYQQNFAGNNEYYPPANDYQKSYQQSYQQYEQQKVQGNCQQWVPSGYDYQQSYYLNNEQNHQSNNHYYPPANDYQKDHQQSIQQSEPHNFQENFQQWVPNGYDYQQSIPLNNQQPLPPNNFQKVDCQNLHENYHPGGYGSDAHNQNYEQNYQENPINGFKLLPLAIPVEESMGGLLPVGYQRTDERYEDEQNNDNSFGNNNNNNNNFNGNVPQVTFELGKVPVKYKSVEHEQLPIDKKELKKARNRRDRAKCDKKKKDAHETLKKNSTQLIRDHEALQFNNKCQEFKLEFAIKKVLLPVLTGNNANIPFNENDLNQQLQEFERDKQSIYDSVNKERMENNEVSKKEKAYAKAQKNFDIADFRSKNREFWAKQLNKSQTTIGTRRSRAKFSKETGLFKYQIIWYRYEMDSQRQISRILEWNLNRLRPWVKNVLENFRGDLLKLYNECRMEAQEAEAMRFFLYRDAG